MWKPEHRAAAERRGLRYPGDLSDAEWALVEPLIPPAKRGGRKRRKRSVNLREVLNAIFYVLSTGCEWNARPKGPTAEEHGVRLSRLVGLGRHAGAHPSHALHRGPRTGRTRSQPDDRDHRQPHDGCRVQSGTKAPESRPRFIRFSLTLRP